MIGRVRQDEFGRQLLAGLMSAGVNADRVTPTPDVASGCAAIAVDDLGENSIAVIPGANALLSPEVVDAWRMNRLATPQGRRVSVYKHRLS